MKNQIKLGLLVLLVVFVSACNSTRHLPFASFSLQPHTEKTLQDEIFNTENHSDYTQISRFSGDYTGVKEQTNFKGYIRMAQDSLLMMSVSGMVGGEAFRVLLSPTQSQSLNRLDEVYTVSDGTSEDQLIPLPFELLQAVFNYRFTPLIRNYNLSIEDHMYVLHNSEKKGEYTSLKIDGNYMVRQLFFKDITENLAVSVNYNAFQEIGEKQFPKDIEVRIDNKMQTVILNITLKRVDFKDKMSFPFSIPQHYLN